LSLSLTLAAIMRGVQPLSSWTSGSKPFCCTSREKMSKLLAEAAQWMGSRPSSSFNSASFGSACYLPTQVSSILGNNNNNRVALYIQ